MSGTSHYFAICLWSAEYTWQSYISDPITSVTSCCILCFICNRQMAPPLAQGPRNLHDRNGKSRQSAHVGATNEQSTLHTGVITEASVASFCCARLLYIDVRCLCSWIIRLDKDGSTVGYRSTRTHGLKLHQTG